MKGNIIKMPRVVIYNEYHEIVIGDNTYIQVTQFDCKLKDDGKDDVKISFSSSNVSLLSGLNLYHNTLIYLSWGYHDTSLCNSIPYIVYDVTNNYSPAGLTVEISLTDFSSPFDSNGGEPEIFDGEVIEKDDNGNITASNITVSPLDFIWGMMGDNLQFYFMYGDKKYLVKDTVVKGNGYIPDGFLWNLRQYDINGGLFSTPELRLLTNNKHDNTVWMNELPESLQEFLKTKRTIDTSPRRHITILERLIQVMPEGPWFINRRANSFIIHNRGGFGVGNSYSNKNYNFKSDINTIISFRLKYDGKKMDENTIDGVEMNTTLRQVNSVSQFNSTIYALRDLWKEIKANAPSYISSADKSTLGPNLYRTQKEDGKWVTTWGGYQISKDQEDKIKELMVDARKYYIQGGIESKPIYYQDEARIPETQVSAYTGNSLGFTNTVATFNTRVRTDNAKYTFYSTNPDTKKNNRFIGHTYWQLLPQGDTFWQMSNELKDNASKAISGILIVLGDPNLREGITVELYGVGNDSGVYYVNSVKHVISKTGGYKTELEVCKIPKGGLTQMVSNFQNEIKDLDYDQLQEIFQWSTFMGVETRFLWTAPGDPSTLTEEQKKLNVINNREEIMVEGEDGKWVKKYRPGHLSDGTSIGKSYDLNYMDKTSDNKTPWQETYDRQTDSALDYKPEE